MFMHVHMRGYDRDGDGRAMDASFYDKYGAPVRKENAWMHGRFFEVHKKWRFYSIKNKIKNDSCSSYIFQKLLK